MCYGINCLVVADDRHYIRALDRDWHGSAHDARVWNYSAVKPIIEQNRQFLLAGDSAFPLSDVLIKPFSNAEALYDPRKKLFNARHSGLRKERCPMVISKNKVFCTISWLITAGFYTETIKNAELGM